MPAKSLLPAIPLPRAWPSRVKSAILHVISLVQFTIAYTRGWAADSVNTRIRLKAELDRALQDNALLREEIRIKDVRMARIEPHQRPLYLSLPKIRSALFCTHLRHLASGLLPAGLSIFTAWKDRKL